MVLYNVTPTAMARTAGWFQVDHHGDTVWVSADYAIPRGDRDQGGAAAEQRRRTVKRGE